MQMLHHRHAAAVPTQMRIAVLSMHAHLIAQVLAKLHVCLRSTIVLPEALLSCTELGAFQPHRPHEVLCPHGC
jgi:hypothetical protein